MKKILLNLFVVLFAVILTSCSESGGEISISPNDSTQAEVNEQNTVNEQKPVEEQKVVEEQKKELPEDQIIETQVSKEGETYTANKILHYSDMGFSLEYPEEFERFYSDDALMLKFYDASLTITKSPESHKETVMAARLEGRQTMQNKNIEVDGKDVSMFYYMGGSQYTALYFIEHNDATYVIEVTHSVEAMEGVGVDFEDTVESMKFY